MLLSISLVYASTPARQGGNLNLRLWCLKVPVPCPAMSSASKSASKSNMSSSSRSTPLGSPPSLVQGNCEESPLELVWDWDEALAVSTEHRHLVWCAICMPPWGTMSSPFLSKRLWRFCTTYTVVEIVSSSLLNDSTWDGTIAGAFPRSLIDLASQDMICKSKFRFD